MSKEQKKCGVLVHASQGLYCANPMPCSTHTVEKGFTPTKPNTEEWEKRLKEGLLNGTLSKRTGIQWDNLVSFIRQEKEKSYQEGSKEDTELTKAIKKLSSIIDYNHITQDHKTTASMYLDAFNKENTSKYIRNLEERIEQIRHSAYSEILKEIVDYKITGNVKDRIEGAEIFKNLVIQMLKEKLTQK